MPEYWYDHIHLISLDVVKTAEFYEKNFNAVRVNLREPPGGTKSASITLNGSRILIWQAQDNMSTAGTAGGLEHFGIRTDDIEAAVENLKANGVKFRGEITEIRPGVKIVYMWGPDNVLIELLQYQG